MFANMAQPARTKTLQHTAWDKAQMSAQALLLPMHRRIGKLACLAGTTPHPALLFSTMMQM
jgi:hypothetical protein